MTGDDEDESAFRDAMRDVKPLADRDRVAPPPRPADPAPGPGRDDEPVRFELSQEGERIAGLAPGIDRRHLRRLRRGEFPVEARVDLHGLDAAAARRALRDAFERAVAAGERCVLVVHGRGVHSEGEAVLKRALPEWLAEPPLGARVMAFASAAAGDGGAGATYVLMRRPRER